MSNIYIVNASKAFAHSEGRLNDHLADVAEKVLSQTGHSVRRVRVDDGYETGREVEQYLWADSILYQLPAWWMGAPWTLKKYMDDVFTAGAGSLYRNDGRTRSDPTRKYGSGGLLQGRTYLLSSTWNAPLEAFTDPEQLFEGRGMDGPLFPLHKANAFLGLTPLPGFMCNDVMKQPRIEEDTERFTRHLQTVYPA